MAGLAALGALAVWFLIYALVLTGLQEHGSQARLYDQYRLQLAAETAPLAEPIRTGSPVAILNSSSGHIHNLVVVEGTTSRLLAQGAGHRSDTPLPGQAGTSVILGRSVTYGAPFRHLRDMKVGEALTVTTGQGVFTYRVEDMRSSGSGLPPHLQSGQSRLTLVTSASHGWRSGWAPTQTIYLDALMAHGKAQPVPPGVPATVSSASLPMQNDPGATVPVIFWLEALLGVSAAVGWSWVRWGRAQTWIVGVPVLLFVLWGTSGALMRFLPNLL
jgi:sortase A